jgi:Ser/Thr protein kinase RdoA (MazF antagonist)
MISKATLEAVRRCYGLDSIEDISQIHEGTNRVYKLLCLSGPDVKKAALKLTRITGHKDILHKGVQQKLLASLGDEFPFVPEILPPQTARNNGFGGVKVHQWGIVCDGAWAVSLYEWIDCKPFGHSRGHLTNAGKKTGQMQECLSRLDFYDTCIEDRSASSVIFFSRMGYEINGLFSFDDFEVSLKNDPESKAASYACENLSLLEEELESALKWLNNNKELLRSQPIGLAHSELSPSNFGFDAAGEVNVIFDFDSIRHGIRSQDIAWMVCTFCIKHSETVACVQSKISLLLDSIDSALALKNEDIELADMFIRINYLEAIHRKLADWHSGRDKRMGFIKDDILALKWLKDNRFNLRVAYVSARFRGVTE